MNKPSVRSTMDAVELSGLRQVRLVEHPVPAIGPTDVLVQVEAVGLCGSDLHAYHGTHPFRKPPVVLGHEPTGRVVARGDRVDGLPIGTPVAVEPLGTCGGCPPCLTGRTNLCEHKEYPATAGWPGAMATYFRVPAAKTYILPAGLDWRVAALAEPLAVACHAFRSLAGVPDRLVILGGGSIGLLTLTAARASGVGTVVVSDVVARKLVMAEQFGAIAHDGRAGAATGLVDRLGGPAAGVVVTAAAPELLDLALAVSAPGATVVVVALSDEPFLLHANQLVLQERTVRGSVLYTREDFLSAVELLSTVGDQLYQLVTDVLPLSSAAEAFDRLDTGRGDPVKILLTPERFESGEA